MDIAEMTVQVLSAGLDEPSRLETGRASPVSCWRGERFGAVLFFEASADGWLRTHCAITMRVGDGWEEPQGWGGREGAHPLWDEENRTLHRPRHGWLGSPVVSNAVISTEFPAETDTDAVAPTDQRPVTLKPLIRRRHKAVPIVHPQLTDVRIMELATSMDVASIELRQPHSDRVVRVAPSTIGSAIIGAEGGPCGSVTAFTNEGHVVREDSGKPWTERL